MVDSATCPLTEADVLSVAELCSRSWFKRLWVRQEITLGHERAVVLCGSRQIPWACFTDAMSCIVGIAMSKLRLSPSQIQMFQISCHRVIELRELKNYKSPMTTVFLNRECECTDERDRVYAILNLHSDVRLDIQ